jgi:hypothetical protein
LFDKIQMSPQAQLLSFSVYLQKTDKRLAFIAHPSHYCGQWHCSIILSFAAICFCCSSILDSVITSSYQFSREQAPTITFINHIWIRFDWYESNRKHFHFHHFNQLLFREVLKFFVHHVCSKYRLLLSITIESDSRLKWIASETCSLSSVQSIVIPRNVQFIDMSVFTNMPIDFVLIERGNTFFWNDEWICDWYLITEMDS